ncbi:YtxH domain-containing protein [Robertmurraya andreesenii]|uniref:Gas vesicle protein n=1 Tax=Anoxybacillus andreesenii TaxID=1325932 RepID=A0ABT9V6J4_9BACL|nr:YtxH domain-containing protein [Robertmurraya andreesenii]MDQ0156565.1 gas vesicle protein [Robertmurraya andreesenii]
MRNHEEQKEHNLSSRDFLLGAIIGGAIGAAAAFFLTPKAGKELRQNLSTQAQSLREKTGQFRDAAVGRGSEWVDAAKEKTSSIGQAVSKQSTELFQKVKALKPQTGDRNESDEDAAIMPSTSGDYDIQRKLEETKRAFDETEQQLNQ